MSVTKTDYNLLTTRLADQQKRLISLQVSLQDALRQGSITKAQYSDRIAFLTKQLSLHRHLGAWQAAEEVSLTQESNLGLPNLDECTPEERKVCYEYLKLRADHLDTLTKEAAAILDAVEAASYGRSGFFGHIFALSKLRKALARIERALAGLVIENNDAEQILASMNQQAPRHRTSNQFRENLEAVMTLFQDLDRRSARVAQLKSTIRDEQEHIRQMDVWLVEENEALSLPLTFSPPPTIEASTKLAWNVYTPEKTYLQKTSEKISLAEKYIEMCIKQKNVTQDTKPKVTSPNEDLVYPRREFNPQVVKPKKFKRGRP